MKIKLALIAEDFQGEVLSFDSIELARAFAEGFRVGGNSYGCGHCEAVTLQEAQNYKQEEPKNIMWNKVINALKK